ncbi:MAG TPA: substrate-binding domain-containing protein [Pyrinomonadaceae bacterium]|nr:substrate-binding domain-containing protein [Pyrinomonadaceae bacterium]
MSSRFHSALLSQRLKLSHARAVFALAFVVLVALALFSCAKRDERAGIQTAVAQTQAPQPTVARRSLRVCADPNNLPFSNEKREGFENRIAELIAREMNLPLEYTWWAQRRGFIRNTLKAGLCDVVIGLPTSYELALTTAPYYRSTYAFVYRRDSGLKIRSFDDEALRRLKIGVQLIGDDLANTPPAHALSNRQIVENVKGYTVYGDYSKENPPARIIEAVAKGEVDVAIAWGPLAGYFARRERTPLEVVPVQPEIDQPFLPFVFDISMGVRRGDEGFKAELEEILNRRRAEIERILDDYGVPRVGQPKQGSER